MEGVLNCLSWGTRRSAKLALHSELVPCETPWTGKSESPQASVIQQSILGQHFCRDPLRTSDSDDVLLRPSQYQLPSCKIQAYLRPGVRLVSKSCKHRTSRRLRSRERLPKSESSDQAHFCCGLSSCAASRECGSNVPLDHMFSQTSHLWQHCRGQLWGPKRNGHKPWPEDRHSNKSNDKRKGIQYHIPA